MLNILDNSIINFLVIVLSSSGVATIISGIISINKSRIDYRNKYFEKLVEKRMESYEMIEELLRFFSTSMRDESDNKFYHIIFDPDQVETRCRFAQLLMFLGKSNLWISNEVADELSKFNLFIIENNIQMNSVDDGKKYYEKLGYLRNNLMLIVKKDILKLYQVNKIKNKKIKKGMIKISIKGH